VGGFTSQHGAGTSPIVCDDKVILANDQDGFSELLALDAATGKPAWRSPRKAFRTCYSTPFVLERPAQAKQLIVASTAGVTSYNPRTGAENWAWTWKFTGMALRTVASPLYSRGMIFATSGDGSGARNMVALKLGDKGAVHMAWQNKVSLPYVPTMLTRGEHLYWVNDHGLAGCQVAATGETVWTKRLGEPVTASPVLIDGKIYAVSEAGNVHVFAAASVFKRLAKNAVGEAVMASPAVADNRLFIRGNRHLFCIGK
jgi:outer membrane protein assembly factor BamB